VAAARAGRSVLYCSVLYCSALSSCGLLLACSLRALDDLESSAGALREEPCPEDMQQASFEDGATFCIDRRETTRAQYDEFLSAPPAETSLLLQDTLLCPERPSFVPGGGVDCEAAYEPGVDGELPVACVDLCDAMAYCSFRGKRLCGGRGGYVVDEESVNSAADDEWFVACAGESNRPYPYGVTFAPGLCNINSPGLAAVNGVRGCETPDHVEQMSGNVSEWVLICREFPRRQETRCLARGGDYLTTDRSTVGCYQMPRDVESDPEPPGHLPTLRSPGIGIRCCRD